MSAKAKPEAAQAAADEKPVEESLKTLEAIVEALEGGRLDLDSSFAKFEEAVRISRSLKKRLDAYERKIELVTGVDAEGKPISEPFPEKDEPAEG
ncbi:MAG: exodeoxyribonuclease VII small subunit [Spirochaetes bacterium]|nr:exodeoxyribonuclease VII small subunit [Spirochaetota bacterium]